jgi:hypothetical protein
MSTARRRADLALFQGTKFPATQLASFVLPIFALSLLAEGSQLQVVYCIYLNLNYVIFFFSLLTITAA